MRGMAYNAAMKVNAADPIIEVGGIKIGPSLTKGQAEKLYILLSIENSRLCAGK